MLFFQPFIISLYRGTRGAVSEWLELHRLCWGQLTHIRSVRGFSYLMCHVDLDAGNLLCERPKLKENHRDMEKERAVNYLANQYIGIDNVQV